MKSIVSLSIESISQRSYVDKYVYMCYFMTETRRRYLLHKRITVNEIRVDEVIIDSLVDKHKDHVDDQLILTLVTRLAIDDQTSIEEKDGFSYFISFVEYHRSIFRLVWVIEKGKNYIGVLTVFKDRGANKR
ncbi:MAG: hypothetical protein OHK0056_13140 [Bacteriovoracaceae bacterium]